MAMVNRSTQLTHRTMTTHYVSLDLSQFSGFSRSPGQPAFGIMRESAGTCQTRTATPTVRHLIQGRAHENDWLALAVVLAYGGPARADEPIAVNLLYAGNRGSKREKAFTADLGKHFARVTTADYQKLTTDQASGHSVVILNWTSVYPRDGGR